MKTPRDDAFGRVRTGLLVLVGATSFPSSAAADASRDAVVSLDDGTTARGRLVEVVPGDHCIVVLANGERRTIPWRSIAHIEDGAGAPPPPREDPTTTVQTAVVTIASERAVTLQRNGEGGTWQTACTSP